MEECIYMICQNGRPYKEKSIILREGYVFMDSKKVNHSHSMQGDEEMDYAASVGSFMPHKERIIVDHPIHPEQHMEEQELREEYERIYLENGIAGMHRDGKA